MTSAFDRTLSVVLTLGVVTIAALVVRREFFPQEIPGKDGEYVSSWRDILPASRNVHGNASAPITVIEFSDFQCPVCKVFHSELGRLEREFPGMIHHAFVHFPLPNHSNAIRAAHAAECSARSGNFSGALDVLFANQDSLGNRDWAWFARTLQLGRPAEFQRCLNDSSAASLIQTGKEMGSRIGVRGTPTVILQGWRYPGMPPASEMTRAVKELLAGKPPYRGFSKEAAARAKQ